MRGSNDRNRMRQSTRLRWSMRKRYRSFSMLTPIQMLSDQVRSAAVSASLRERFVRILEAVPRRVVHD